MMDFMDLVARIFEQVLMVILRLQLNGRMQARFAIQF